jgi:hypothetical protein
MTVRIRHAAVSAMLLITLVGCASGTPTGSTTSNPSTSANATATTKASATSSPRAGSGDASLKGLPVPDVGTYTYSVAIDLGPENSYGGERKLSYYSTAVRGAEADQYVRQTTAFTGSEPKEWWFHYRWRADGFYEVANVQPEGSTCLLDRYSCPALHEFSRATKCVKALRKRVASATALPAGPLSRSLKSKRKHS